MYNEKVLKNFANPHNAGGLHKANAVGKIGNVLKGDIVKFYFKINDETKIIEEARFKTFGCTAAIACSNIACDMVKGKTIEEALLVSNGDIIKALGGLPMDKIYCVTSVEGAIKETVNNYKKNE
ncbi:MAG: iron-sulfur cluster assembly scaffold protein [Clostridia bacterium]|nr:iron-sulfur cluster assembly scaffold protein [Clostridia bacterium]